MKRKTIKMLGKVGPRKKKTVKYKYAKMGKVIREARIKAGMSQLDLAKAIGLTSQAIVSFYEAGKLPLSASHCVAVARKTKIKTSKIERAIRASR